MRKIAVPLLLSVVAVPALAQTPASAPPSSRAIELFRSDWVIMDWGLRFHDRDRNAELSAAEAEAGASAFKELADGDGDGRVTPHEFAAARQFLLARY